MNYLEKTIEITVSNVNVVFLSAAFVAISLCLCVFKRRYFSSAFALLLGLGLFGYLGGILFWLSGLGGDSFLEVKGFDVREGVFWVCSFFSSLPYMLMPLNKASVLLACEVVTLSVLLLFMLRWWPVTKKLLVVLVAVFFVRILFVGYAGFESGRSYVASLKKSFDHNPDGFVSTADVDLFVYIGESTSTLNMSLYGYPLATTPKLDNICELDNGFLRFEGVRSTHTHTSLSLLRALAVTVSRQDGSVARWGIGRVLDQAGIVARLYSVQPLNGSFATFSRFVFDGMKFDLPADDKYKGDFASLRVKDDVLLEAALKDSGPVFFHSYAGHGPYRDLIDPSLSARVDRPLIGFSGVYGDSFFEAISADLVRNVRGYDEAITYVDRNVSRAVDNIKKRKKPAVLVYFSDHGDAVYAKRGHDSSNYIDEMTTVPMVLYFNEAYRYKYPGVFKLYSAMAASKGVRLLDQVAPTILDLLRVKFDGVLDVPTLADTKKHPRPYIVERDTVSGSSRIDLEYDREYGFSKSPFYGGTPEPTYISIINNEFGGDNRICYHRADSYAKALRAASVTNCLEVDLVVNGNSLDIYHPPAAPTGFTLKHVFEIAQFRKNAIWVDSKNLSNPAACEKLAGFIEANRTRVGQIFVEFPSESVGRLADLESCSRRMKSVGVRTSYYVPTHLASACSDNRVRNAAACQELEADVRKVVFSGLFSDLSFDFSGFSAVRRIDGAESLKWNTWAIRAKDFHLFPRRNFDFVIMDTGTDPNTY